MALVVFWTWIKGGLTQAVLVLAALAFVLVPTADAAVCVPEPPSAEAALSGADLAAGRSISAPLPDPGADPDCEACLHGHCHNQGQIVSLSLAAVQAAWSMKAGASPLTADRAPPGVALTLPQRPPRS